MTHVLIVEDHPETQQVLAAFVRERGHFAHSAASVSEARAEAARQQPTLAIIDLGLPDGSGLTLASEMLALEGTTVALMTGNANLETALAGFRYGVVDYLEKPVSFERLDQLLEQAIQESEEIVLPVGTSVADAYRELMLMTLKHCGGDKKRTAEILGISVKTLYNRLHESFPSAIHSAN